MRKLFFLLTALISQLSLSSQSSQALPSGKNNLNLVPNGSGPGK